MSAANRPRQARRGRDDRPVAPAENVCKKDKQTMTKASLDLPSGARVDIDGTPEEISQLLHLYASAPQPIGTPVLLPFAQNPAGGARPDGRLLAVLVGVMAVALAVMGGLGYSNLKSVNDGLTAMYFDQTVPLGDLGPMQAALGQAQAEGLQFVYVPEARAASEKALMADSERVNGRLANYRAAFLTADDKAALDQFESAWSAYQELTDGVLSAAKAGDDGATRGLLAQSDAALKSAQDSLAKLTEVKIAQSDVLNREGAVVFARAAILMVAVGLVEVLLMVGLAVWVVRRSQA